MKDLVRKFGWVEERDIIIYSMLEAPERRQRGPEVIETKDELELPAHLKDEGVEAVETAFKAQVKDKGQKLIQTPQNQKTQIQLPRNQATLTAWSKGPITNAATWLARFWLRAIKKAVSLGIRVVNPGS